ncbi:DUF4014 domain-containing protein [Salmonella enterica]|uniref:DUF4014 domain-containing protein n=1 Tax=Salmonella enterica TaxID=28901 RepID=A0A5U3IJL9_SALER|nr:DUF4014 domain-containing protein [Salmonella enterica]
MSKLTDNQQRIAALDDAVTSLFFRHYPRRSRAVEAIFFLLFVIVMLPLWPLADVCLLDRLSGKIIDGYSVV